MLLLVGCATLVPRDPAPIELADSAQIPGIPNARFWGDDIPPSLERALVEGTDELFRNRFPAMYRHPHEYLAISGGGADGAFGAGLLVGWSQAGGRPEFQIVTGISTGALIAPWAFLGSAYDHVLREIYTTVTTVDLVRKKRWFRIPFSESAADSTPLLHMIERHMDDAVVAAIAAQYRMGRRLYIGTTDLDYMRPRIWDIGAIADSGQPGAKELIQKVMLASASIPGAFPPVRFNVEAAGRTYDELHVDGGTTTQVFVYPAAIDWRKVMDRLQVPGSPRIFVIRNSAPHPKREVVAAKLAPIARASIASLIRTQGIGDLYLIYMLSIRDGADFNLAYIPAEFDGESQEMFDQGYMNKLFDLGYRLAENGYPWEKTPPQWADKTAEAH